MPGSLRAKGYICALGAMGYTLAGCAADKPTYRYVKVVNDTYCLNTEKQTYSTKDTTKTIDGVRRSERKRACLCEKPKPKGC